MSDVLLEPWPLRGTGTHEPTPPIEKAIADATDRLTTERGVRIIIREKKMSLLGKLQHLTESAQDFHKKTEASLDGIGLKIDAANKKREQAEGKHHAYYDAIIAGVDDSMKVIDRLSNGPLHEDGQS